jgi:BBSome-interacting protein 1
VLARAGLVYSEKSTLSEILCKPKIMPLKSVTLEKIEQMEREAAERGFKAEQQYD